MYTLSCPSAVPPDAARLKEVGSKLRNNARIWHQDMLFETWEEWKVEVKKILIGHKPDPQHLLSQFQEYANKVLVQQTKGFLGTERKLIIDNFHSLVGISTFENALTPVYAGLIRKTNPSTLEEAYNLVRKNYTIYVEREQDKDVKAMSKWNPFAVEAKKRNHTW
ncbi:hypothetical protein DSO57_1027462 [Entomophthora muscae]|uniref:Uncharacterized protein n=1 Tax=Entomophthora muscae TaxID=34485 RepID=A0ACC2RSR7_9FUNG|nr:hypothetical protein DSO57_1027462 [Entomophthora muscae]